MIYQINSTGQRIIAGEDFVEARHAGDYTLIGPEAPPVSPVPRAITMEQARLALNDAGLLSGVSGAINAMPGPAKARAAIKWEYASEVRRGSALVAALGTALGLTDAQIDDLFIAGSQL